MDKAEPQFARDERGNIFTNNRAGAVSSTMVVGCTPLNGWIKHTVTGLANPHDAAGKNKVHKVSTGCCVLSFVHEESK